MAATFSGGKGAVRLGTCLWFDGQAEEAANFYTKVFGGTVDNVMRAPGDYPDGKKGSVLTAGFTILGHPFMALNGGPQFKFNEAISLMVHADQAEADRIWKALSAVPQAEQCGWLKDKFGVSWQVVPDGFMELMNDKDPKRAGRAFQAMMQMKRLDVAQLRKAADGK